MSRSQDRSRAPVKLSERCRPRVVERELAHVSKGAAPVERGRERVSLAKNEERANERREVVHSHACTCQIRELLVHRLCAAHRMRASQDPVEDNQAHPAPRTLTSSGGTDQSQEVTRDDVDSRGTEKPQ